jgi:26S proteasome regulatory subunit N12
MSQPSAAAVAAVEANVTAFRSATQKEPTDLAVCQTLLSKLKIGLIQFQLLPPFDTSSAASLNSTKKQLLLARESLELAIFLSVKQADSDAFERHMAQVRPYYQDYKTLLDDSERRHTIQGLWLMHLLARNRIAEFHTELEALPADDQANLYIRYPVQLEQRLMEGIYNKIFAARKLAPTPAYTWFLDQLVVTVRGRIAECCEAAYESMTVKDAEEQLGTTAAELKTLVAERKWTLEKERIVFKQASGPNYEVPSFKIINQQLGYATELERIV